MAHQYSDLHTHTHTHLTLEKHPSSHREYVRVVGHLEQLAGLSQADAVERGQVVTARQDAHVAELLLREHAPQGATATQVGLVNLQPVALLVHLQQNLISTVTGSLVRNRQQNLKKLHALRHGE